MIPRTEISGFGGSSPWLWPMGAGGPPPRRMTMAVGWRSGYRWDGDGRLLETEEWSPRGRLSFHFRYLWNGDRLDRMQRLTEAAAELGNEIEYEYVWIWGDDDRPISMQRWNTFGTKAGNQFAWAWSADGRSARVTETSSVGLRSAQTVTYDAAWRLVRIAREQVLVSDIADVIDIAWHDDGRIDAARSSDHTVTYRWDDRGRLIGQTSTQYPGADVCTYHHE